MLKSLKDKLKTLSNYRWLIIANIYLISPVIIHDLIDKVGIFTLTSSFLWLLIFHSRVEAVWKLHMIFFPFYLIVFMELFMLAYLDSRLSSSYISILLGQYQHYDDFISLWSKEIAISVLLFITFYVYMILALKNIKLSLPDYVLPIAVVLIVALYTFVTIYQMNKNDLSFSDSVVDVLAHDKNSPVGIFSTGYTTYRVLKHNVQRRLSKEGYKFGAYSSNKGTPEIHVIVIGESSRPDHWGLNGYYRNTTPLLANTPNIISFPNVISEVALTRLSVPLILSRESIRDIFHSKKAEKSLVTAFSEAGYTTVWLSGVLMDKYSGEIIDLSHEADIQRYHERRYDNIMLDSFDDVIGNLEEQSKIFVVFHTQGSHFDYSKRYPSEYNKFNLGHNYNRKEYITNTYDNSILYTDNFLSEVIERLDKIPVISSLMYISDHGENLLDDEQNILGHFRNNEYDLSTAMIFWASEEFILNNPEKYKALNKSSSYKNSTHSIFYTMLDIGNVAIDYLDMSPSMSRLNYQPITRWIMRDNNIIPYDQEYDILK